MTEDARELAAKYIREGKAVYKGKISKEKFEKMLAERDTRPEELRFRKTVSPQAGVAILTPIHFIDGKQKPRLSEIYDLI